MKTSRTNRMEGSNTPYGILIPKTDRKKPQPNENAHSHPDKRTNPDSSEQVQENEPSGEWRRPVTNQDEQRKTTNIDDNNDIVE